MSSPSPKNGHVVEILMEAKGATKEMNPSTGESQSDALIQQLTPSKTSTLVNFLPTGTLLIFNSLISPVSGYGKCNTVSFTMTILLLSLCVCSCFFFQLVDSYSDGKKVYNGIVTTKGLLLFNSDLKQKYREEEQYILKLSDVIYAVGSAFVFVVFAFSDKRVIDCLLPAHETVMTEVMKTLPLMVSITCSGFVMLIPNTRFGVGMRG